MSRFRPFAWLVFFLVLASFVPARAQPLAYDASLLHPDEAQFSLLSVGIGNGGAHQIGGHLVLRVRQGHDDWAFDWGVFDSRDPNFFWNYLRGILDYYHIIRPTSRMMRSAQYENRPVLEDKLVLTREQRVRLIAGLVDWAKPENRVYPYDLVQRNCTTVIRDLLAKAIGPGFEEPFKVENGLTIRTSGRRYFGYFPPLAIMAETLFSGRVDVPIKKWDMFYLPVLVREMLAELPAFDDDSKPIPGTHLLDGPVTILEGKHVGVLAIQWGYVVSAFFIVLSAIGLRWKRVASVSMLFAGVIFGGLGVLVPAFWGLTRHMLTYDNVNIAVVWPFDLALIGAAFIVFFKGRVPRWVGWLAAAHLVISGLATAAWAVGAVRQDISIPAVMTLPFWALTWMLAKDSKVSAGSSRSAEHEALSA